MTKDDTPRQLRDHALSAVALLTRVPVPDHAPKGAASAWAWPLVGALVGLAAAAGASLAVWVGAGPGAAAVAGLIVQALLTGALHEDGLADTADGLLGGRTADRRLEIMKDSRIGSFGALALMLVTLASWSALEGLVEAGLHWLALPAAAALSRAPMAVVMAALPPARPNGLSAASGQPSALTALAAVGVALAVALILCGPGALWAAVGVAAVSAGLALAAQARIGGQTGDILGACQQLSFAAALSLLA